MRSLSPVAFVVAIALCLHTLLPAGGQEQLPLPKQSTQLEGYWSCLGEQGSGPYEGVVLVKQVEGSGVYAVSWSGLAGGIVGCGRVEGDLFVVGWANGKGAGLTVMKKAAGGWEGHYSSIPTDGKAHKETWTFLKHLAAKDVLP